MIPCRCRSTQRRSSVLARLAGFADRCEDLEGALRALARGGAETTGAERGGGADRTGVGFRAGALRGPTGCSLDTGILADAGARTTTSLSGRR